MSTHKVDLGLGNSKPENLNASLNHGRAQRVGNPVQRDALNTEKSKQKFGSQLSNSLIHRRVPSAGGRDYKIHQTSAKGASPSPSESKLRHKQSLSGLAGSLLNQSSAPKTSTSQNKSTALGSNSSTLYTSIRKAILNEISGAKASAQQANVYPQNKEVSHELYSSRKSPQLRDIIESRQKDVGAASIYELHRSSKEPDNSKLGISIAGSTSLGVLTNKHADVSVHEPNSSGTLSSIQKKIKVMLSGHSTLLPKERSGSNQSVLLPNGDSPSLTVNLHETVVANKQKAVDELQSGKILSKKTNSQARVADFECLQFIEIDQLFDSDSSAVVSAMSLKLLSRGRNSETKVGDQSSKLLSTKAVDTSNKDYTRKFFGEQQSHAGMTSKTIDAKSYIEKALGKSTIQESMSKRPAGSSLIGPNSGVYSVPANASSGDEQMTAQQHLQLKGNPLYQRFSQKLAAKPVYEAVDSVIGNHLLDSV